MTKAKWESKQIQRVAIREANRLKGSLMCGDAEVEWLTSMDGVSVVLTRHQFEEMTRDLIALFGEVSCG